MRLAIGLTVVAVLSGAAVAYGVDPIWMRWAHGLDVITTARRMQWPILGISLAGCLGLLGLIISGRNRAGWLLALVPVLALLSHRFLTGPIAHLRAVEDPAMMDSSAAGFLGDADNVVGIHFEGVAYALPMASLYHAPMVLMSGRENRLAVFWSMPANRVLAMTASRELRGGDLEVIGFPADALLVYDSRLGLFINGLTGCTPAGAFPPELHEPLRAVKVPWLVWRTLEPKSKVMVPTEAAWPSAPREPIQPNQPLPANRPELLDTQRVCLVACDPPVALSAAMVGATPVNVLADNTPVLLFRDPIDQGIRAFDRRLPGDLVPRFLPTTDPKRPNVHWTDTDTGAGWTTQGLAVTGPKDIVGKRLTPILVDENLPLGVLRYWYPTLTVLTPERILPAVAPPAAQAPGGKPTSPRHRRARRAAGG